MQVNTNGNEMSCVRILFTLCTVAKPREVKAHFNEVIKFINWEIKIRWKLCFNVA